jgi:hypothetical protein
VLIHSPVAEYFDLGNYEWNQYKHFRAGFCVDISFQFSWTNAQEGNRWVFAHLCKELPHCVQSGCTISPCCWSAPLSTLGIVRFWDVSCSKRCVDVSHFQLQSPNDKLYETLFNATLSSLCIFH